MVNFTGKKLSSFFPVFIIISFCLTILIGLLGTILPSINYLPVIGHDEISLTPWNDFFSYPGIGRSISVTLISGLSSTVGVVLLAFIFISLSYGNRLWRFFVKILPPVLSIPHASFAVGFAFLIAPSGWIIRLISPSLSGLNTPPDIVILNDPLGICLAVALIIKEFPFLILVTIGALGQLDIEKTLITGRTLGYQTEQIWFKIIIPRLYKNLRLPIFAVIAYSLSVVDMAILLGPTSPPTLSVLVLQWFNDADINLKLLAAAGSLFLFLLVGTTILLVKMAEMGAHFFFKGWVINGTRKTILKRFKQFVYIKVIGVIIFTMGSSLVLMIWSLTWRWRFPDAFPVVFTLKHWAKGLIASQDPVITTIVTGFVSSFFALVLTIGCLEHEVLAKKESFKNFNQYIHYFLYLPLMIPQITFMAGIQLLLVIFNLDGYWITLVWSHLLFVLPYTFISLGQTYLTFDSRFFDQAKILKKSYLKALFVVKLPMLMRPILFAFAIGFSVSVAQYIPTILVGAGRYSTITTEVVSIASGSDRRILAVYALIQHLLPMIIFVFAMVVPKILFYKRKGMQA